MSQVIINTVNNGFVVEYKSIHEDKDHSDIEVFEVLLETQEERALTMQRLLYHINDLIGPSSSRYDEHRVYVEIKPGDKHSKFEEQDNE